MKHYQQHIESLWPSLQNINHQDWIAQLPSILETALHPDNNGNVPRWLPALNTIYQMPTASQTLLNQAAVTAKLPSLNPEQQLKLTNALKTLMPWRKGPFQIDAIYIDTEWRSDWKWDRIQSHLSPLKGRKVLDIGCGSGYHLWRMLGEEAELAVGVDPSLLFMSQFITIKHFLGEQFPAFFLPLTLEQLPATQKSALFDTVFSMGVLYHRRSPIDHILDLKRHLKPGGELVLETLVVPDDYGQLLVPEARYAQMNNVWFLPSVAELQRWLEKCGFRNVRCVDIDQTSTDEQRSTEWMEWKSLADFLNPNDMTQTIEGYPAPLRAVMIANKPS